eukprot:CAMPEP_0203964216 /NCGR_PEP_ID=MMETSP0359-20131031/94010_1 /ASSEMBLY_ACC=CAM_ASM_000338 /TAXON_ID=268821 /ORGANISM="Scrippsiella Hangoei, Strain SHTV-5" /LENGTH=225 /DNA_ID=CAMNT_0050900515 /DNA_START=84 /DNA_END=761 /DNA_ORIENTATION=-
MASKFYLLGLALWSFCEVQAAAGGLRGSLGNITAANRSDAPSLEGGLLSTGNFSLQDGATIVTSEDSAGWGNLTAEELEALWANARMLASKHHHHHHGGHHHHHRGGHVMTLYHQTSPHIGALILKGGFKPGSRGWCGGGIYFATTPEATKTKAIGADSHTGFMIEARVDVGKALLMPATCDRSMTGLKLASKGFDSVKFNPGDGDEYIVYSGARVISTKHYGKR